MYLYVDDAKQTFKNAINAGTQVIENLKEEPWGDLRGRVLDPFGYVWDLATKIEKNKTS